MDSPKNLTKKQKVVDWSTLRMREGLCYEADSDTSFTGKAIGYWWSTPRKKIEGEWCDGKASGKWIYWHENGTKEAEGNYRDGKMCEEWTDWHGNGQKDKEGKYRNGKRHGKWIWWHENGNKEAEGEYRDDKRYGKFTYWHNNGKVAVESGFHDDKPHGKGSSWYPNGLKEKDGGYCNGKRHGKWIWWHENGNKEAECEFHNGKLHGKATRWYNTGLKQREFDFCDGEMITNECWDENRNPIPCSSIIKDIFPSFGQHQDIHPFLSQVTTPFLEHDLNSRSPSPIQRRIMKHKSKKWEFEAKKNMLAILYSFEFTKTKGEWHKTEIIRKNITPPIHHSRFDDAISDNIYERLIKSLLYIKPPLIETDLPIFQKSIPFFPDNLSMSRHIRITNTGIKEVKSWSTVKLPAGTPIPATGLTSKHPADYDKFEYKSQDRLHIPGTFPRKRSNDIFINDHKISLGDSLFALLMRFVVELKKGKGGRVNTADLMAEHFINDTMAHQPYSNLRNKLEGSLKEKDGEKFIESSGSMEYRLSTHPDFVTYDKKKLKAHPDPRIAKIAKGLP